MNRSIKFFALVAIVSSVVSIRSNSEATAPLNEAVVVNVVKKAKKIVIVDNEEESAEEVAEEELADETAE